MTGGIPVPVPGASRRIADAVRRWRGVSVRRRRRGEVEFRLGRRQLGHLHGDVLADLPLPRPLADEVVAAGRARRHSWKPDSGWVSRSIAGEEDVQAVIALLRLAYDRAVIAQERLALA